MDRSNTDNRYGWNADDSWSEPGTYTDERPIAVPMVMMPLTSVQVDDMSVAVANADYGANTQTPPPEQPVAKKNFWDTVAELGNTAANVLNASKNTTATPPIVYNSNGTTVSSTTPTATDKGKKTTMIILIMVGVVVVGTLLYLALKKSK